MLKIAVFAGAIALGSAVFATPALTVSGSVDGSGVMQVNTNSVSWTNLYFNTPTALSVNGTAWNPSAQPTMSMPGPLVPDNLSNYFVSTALISGRDVANAQVVGGQLLVYFADTLGGADNYSIAVSFDPKSAPVLSTPATLHITGNIDGSDLLRISRTSATWIHNYFGAPSNVTINGMPWDTVNNPTLPNSGATTFLPPGVDLSTVAFTKNAGRDTATYQLFPDHIDVYFADDPVGAGNYDVALSFGAVPEPTAILTIALAGSVLLIAPRRRKEQ